jgi:hypothetical protein
VALATRRNLVRDRQRAEQTVSELRERGEAVRRIADRCTDRIAAAPRLAVPDVSALGAPPADGAGLQAYQARLDQVRRALDVAEATYAAPLAERDELRGRLEGYRAMAASQGRGADPRLAAADQAAKRVLWSAPCDLAVARDLVASYQSLVNAPAEQGTDRRGSA